MKYNQTEHGDKTPQQTAKAKHVEDYTVKDLLLTAEFKSNVKKIIDELRAERKEQNIFAHSHNSELKRHPIDTLNLDTDYLLTQYVAILNKNCTLSSNQRYFIKAVCDEAARKTIKQLQEDESARNLNNGNG